MFLKQCTYRFATRKLNIESEVTNYQKVRGIIVFHIIYTTKFGNYLWLGMIFLNSLDLPPIILLIKQKVLAIRSLYSRGGD